MSFLTRSEFSLCAMLFAVTLYAFFIAASLGLTRSRMSVLKDLEGHARDGARRAIGLLEHSDKFLLCAQFGRVLASLATGALVAISAFFIDQDVSGMTAIQSVQSVWGVALAIYVVCAVLLLVLVEY